MTALRRFALATAAALAAVLSPTPPSADGLGARPTPTVLVATRTIRPGVVLTAADVAIKPGQARPGMLSASEQAVGKETRIALYANRPIAAGALGPPTLVRRNAIVRLTFNLGALRIQTDGRALDSGGLGDRIRVMNLDSRQVVYGSVSGPTLVEVK